MIWSRGPRTSEGGLRLDSRMIWVVTLVLSGLSCPSEGGEGIGFLASLAPSGRGIQVELLPHAVVRCGDRLVYKEEGFGPVSFFEIVSPSFGESGLGVSDIEAFRGYTEHNCIYQGDLDGTSLARARLLWTSSSRLVPPRAELYKVDLREGAKEFSGRAELLDHGDLYGEVTSSRYRPLYTQGLGIGETAETLRKDELILTWYGLLGFGAYDWLSVSSILPLNAFGGPNFQAKAKLFSSNQNKISAGFSAWRVLGTQESVLNLNFMWDSFSNSSVVTHSFVTLAVLSYDNSKDTTAVKSLGSSAFQSGYEFILDNWARVLVGPSYNFETKALGGYVSYLKIWDRFHLQLSLASNNVGAFRADLKEGYYGFFDAYWRF